MMDRTDDVNWLITIINSLNQRNEQIESLDHTMDTINTIKQYIDDDNDDYEEGERNYTLYHALGQRKRKQESKIPSWLINMNNVHGYNVERVSDDNMVRIIWTDFYKDDIYGLQISKEELTRFEPSHRREAIDYISVATLNRALASLSWYDASILNKKFVKDTLQTINKRQYNFGWNRLISTIDNMM